ncbi:glycosyltransferase [bacterium]|nr:glycosyltransferase [bacterium]
MIFVNQINLIDKNKFNPFVGLLYSTNKKDNLYHKLKISDNKIIHFNFKQKLGALDIGGIIRLTKFLRQNKIDIIFTSLFEANFAGRLAAKFAGTKVIVSSEHSCYYDKRYWQKKVDWFLSFFTDKIVAVSNEVADFTSKQEKIDSKKFKVIKQISDISIEGIFNRNELRRQFDIPINAFVCGSLGRFSPEKAQYKIIDMAEILVYDLKIKDIYFIIIGYGALHDELLRLIAVKKLEKYVKIIKDPGLAKEYLVMLDIFILTSIREGFGIVLLEAMNNGLPCIAFNVGGVSEVIRDKESGFLIDNNHKQDFINKILFFYKNKSLMHEFSLRSKKSVDSILGKIEDLEIFFMSLWKSKK